MSEDVQEGGCLAAEPDRLADVAVEVKRRLTQLRTIPKMFRNWPQLVLFRLGLKSNVIAQWRSGGSVDVNSQLDWSHLQQGSVWGLELLRAYGCLISVGENEIELGFRGKRLRFQAESLDKSFGMLLEQFVEEQYKWLRVEGKQVLDVGANIGDSAIYFALNRALHVYALEPFPYTYRLARRNVELNGFEKQITVLNLGCGKEGAITIDPELKSEPSSNLVRCEGGETVPIVSLKRIVERYGLNDAVAKIDCEGGEYELILGAEDRDLRAFSQMMIEYHQGFASLTERLNKAGFQVTHTRPFAFQNPVTGRSEAVGFIKAMKPSN